MSLNDFMMKIPPQALLGLASGLLSPGQTQGQRFGAGLAGMNQGMMLSQFMQDRLLKQKQEQEKLEALKRFQGHNEAIDEAASLGYPDVVTSAMKTKNAQTNLTAADPAAAMEMALKPPAEPETKNYLVTGPDGKQTTQLLRPSHALALQSRGFTVQETGAAPAGGSTFKATNMRIPGTDTFDYADTPEKFAELRAKNFLPTGEALPGAKAPDAPKDTFGEEAKLRGEFDAKTKDFTIVRDAAATIQTVANNPSPAGDISLIFNYMKLLDPGSTVREGEYATAQNAASVPESVRAKFNKIMAGETLTPDQRADFVNQARNVYDSKLQGFTNEFNRYTDLSNIYKIDPKLVVYDRTDGVLPDAGSPPGTPGAANATQPRTIPSAAISYLKANPALREAFDKKYGAGAAARYLGK